MGTETSSGDEQRNDASGCPQEDTDEAEQIQEATVEDTTSPVPVEAVSVTTLWILKMRQIRLGHCCGVDDMEVYETYAVAADAA